MEEKKTTREVVMMNQVKTVCIFLKLKNMWFYYFKEFLYHIGNISFSLKT